MVPHRQLYRVTYSIDNAIPATRSGIVSGYRLMQVGTAYVVTEKMLQRIKLADPNCISEEIPCRPFSPEAKRVLIYFPAGIGDVLCFKPCLEKFRKTYPHMEVAVVSTMADQCLIGDLCTLWDYPIREEVANHYDAWINIAELDIASFGRELSDTFAEYLRVEPPRVAPTLTVDKYIRDALHGYIKDDNKIKVGVHMQSICHFRSIPPLTGMLTMMSLEEKGCDCYLIGVPEQRLVLRDSEGNPCKPPDNIYDMTMDIAPMELFIAFFDLMDVLLCADTSGLHIAGALGKPALGVFGLTDGSKRTGYYPSVDFIQGEADCSPCERIQYSPPCVNKRCLALAGINPEYLAEKVLETWQTKSL